MPEKPLLCVKSSLKTSARPVTLCVFSHSVSLSAFFSREQYSVESMVDLYIEEDRRVTVIDFEMNGKSFRRELSEDDFPGLAAGMKKLLETGWGNFTNKIKGEAEFSVIQGIERKPSLFSMPEKPFIHFKRGKNFKAVKVFSYGITLVSNEEKRYPLDMIEDVFLTLHPGTFERVLVIDTLSPEGLRVRLRFFKDDFPGLHQEMRLALENGWGGFYDKRNESDPIIWFHAISSISAILDESNLFIFSFRVKNPNCIKSEMERVSASWHVPDRNGLIRKLTDLVNCRIIDRYITIDMTESKREAVVRALAIFFMTEAITLSLDGYACDWLSYEESLAWCLTAGKILQPLCRDWDTYYKCMLACHDLNDLSKTSIVDNHGMKILLPGADYAAKNSSSDYRSAYEHLRLLPENPRWIPWDTRLDLETGYAINEKKRKIPQSFLSMPELDKGLSDVASNAFCELLQGLVGCIVSGMRSVVDLKVMLHLAVDDAILLQETHCGEDEELFELVKDSFCESVNYIFRFYAIAIDAFEVWKIHKPPKKEEA
ncbi:MAG: hypothetical protein LBT59_30955 [Clostridiales bacterium]|jgi:hypothetical protein|nr:hypothetical protein [Clostridiales bacterium]